MYRDKLIKYLDEQIVDRDVLAVYEKANAYRWVSIALIMLAILCVAYVSITIGPVGVSVKEAHQIILHHILPSHFESVNPMVDGIVWKVRMPRLLSGMMVGFGLAISGAVMQPILRNPMATPYTLGISSAAGFGAALAIGFGRNLGGGLVSVIGCAFAFALIIVMLIALVAKRKDITPETIILTGIALSYLFNAGIQLLQYLVDPIYTKEMVFWLAGSLYKGNWTNLGYISIAVVVFSSILIYQSKELNSISVGDEVAQSLGVDVERIRLTMMITASLLTAVLVAFTGTIGFVGLVAPHITRMILGGDNKFVVLGSGLTGAFLLMGSDIIAMNVISPTILPIGVVTAFLGVPLFLYLIFRAKRGKCNGRKNRRS